jgi:anti-sigma factor RsiW
MRHRHKNRQQVRRFLDGDLPADAAQRLRQQIMNSDELKAELDQQSRLRRLVSESAGTFDQYFPDRVMARLHTLGRTDDLWGMALFGAFRRIVVVALLLMIVLVSYNISTQWQHRADANAVEMTLAIPPATISSSLDFMDFGL